MELEGIAPSREETSREGTSREEMSREEMSCILLTGLPTYLYDAEREQMHCM